MQAQRLRGKPRSLVITSYSIHYTKLYEGVTALALDHGGATLYAGTGSGFLLRWSLEEPGRPQLLDRLQAFADRRAVTALGLVFGDISLAVGDAQGGVSTRITSYNVCYTKLLRPATPGTGSAAVRHSTSSKHRAWRHEKVV